MKRIRRGDIYYADLNPGIGSEQRGVRPVVVIQNNKGNKVSKTIIVASISSKAYVKHFKATHYELHNHEELGLKQPSVVLLEQIRTIDTSRLIQYKGSLNKQQLQSINKRILVSLGMSRDYKYQRRKCKRRNCTLDTLKKITRI